MTTKPEATQGTGAALERMEQSELELHASFRAAREDLDNYIKSENPKSDVILAKGKNLKLAWDMFRGASDSLVRHESKIDPSKKLAGAILAQAEATQIFKGFIRHWKIGVEQGITSISQTLIKCQTEVEACEAFHDIYRGSVRKAVQRGVDEGRIPGWLIIALEEEL